MTSGLALSRPINRHDAPWSKRSRVRAWPRSRSCVVTIWPPRRAAVIAAKTRVVRAAAVTSVRATGGEAADRNASHLTEEYVITAETTGIAREDGPACKAVRNAAARNTTPPASRRANRKRVGVGAGNGDRAANPMNDLGNAGSPRVTTIDRDSLGMDSPPGLGPGPSRYPRRADRRGHTSVLAVTSHTAASPVFGAGNGRPAPNPGLPRQVVGRMSCPKSATGSLRKWRRWVRKGTEGTRFWRPEHFLAKKAVHP